MSDLNVVRTVDVVAAEIRALTASMLTNVIEIGRRMVEAKELLPHGAFGKWVTENTGYSSSTANNFMRLYEEYGSDQRSLFGAEVNSQTIGKLSYTKALALLALPSDERETFVIENDVESMSTRELKKALQERDAALLEAEKARAEQRLAEQARELMAQDVKNASTLLGAATEERNALREQVKQLQERPLEVAVQEPDPAVVVAAVKAAVAQAEEKHKADLAKMQAELDREVRANNKLEKKLSDMKKDTAEEDKAERLRLEEKVEQLSKQLVMATPEITTFKVQFAAWQTAYKQMMAALNAVPEISADKLRQAVYAQLDAWSRK